MRAIIWVLGLGALFCGWWFGAAALLRAAPAHLVPRGVEIQALEVTGFPSAFDLRLDAPALPARGWRAGWAALSVPSYWPFSAQGTVSGQQSIAWRGAEWRLDGADMPVAVALSTGLEVERAALSGRDMRLSGPMAATLDTLSLRLDRAEAAESYALALDMTGLALAPLGQRLDNASLRARLTYATPLRLTAPGTLAEIELRDARFVSGPSTAELAGTLTRRSDGLWDGALSLRITNWQPIMAALQQSGALPSDQAPLVMMVAQGMSEGDTLTLPLTVTGSILSLGPIPLLDLGRL